MGDEQKQGDDRDWLVEQRYQAVLEVLDGSPVSEVAVRYEGRGGDEGCGDRGPAGRAGGQGEVRCRLELRLAELERRPGMDSTDSGTPSSKERIGAKEGRRARQQSRAGAPQGPQARRAARSPGKGLKRDPDPDGTQTAEPPAERSARLICMLTGEDVSPGWIDKAVARVNARLKTAGFDDAMTAALAAGDVPAADETPMNVLDKTPSPPRQTMRARPTRRKKTGRVPPGHRTCWSSRPRTGGCGSCGPWLPATYSGSLAARPPPTSARRCC